MRYCRCSVVGCKARQGVVGCKARWSVVGCETQRGWNETDCGSHKSANGHVPHAHVIQVILVDLNDVKWYLQKGVKYNYPIMCHTNESAFYCYIIGSYTLRIWNRSCILLTTEHLPSLDYTMMAGDYNVN